MDRRPYAVVTFTGEEQEDEGETIAVVPVKWIDKPDDEITDMFWPPKNWPERGSRLVHLKRAVQNCIEPEIQWPLHKGTVLHLYREYDDAIRDLKKAEDDTSLETEVDGAPRKRKLPKRYLDFDAESENENKENDMLLKKKGLRKRKVRMLNESTTDDSDSTTLPQVNFDILNEVKNVHVSQVENKEREKASRKQPVENHVRFKVLQEFQNNCSQSCQQEQLKKVYNSQCENNVNKKHEKQHKIDNIKQKNLVSNKTIQKKRNALITSSNSKTSFVPSSIKDKVISSTTSEVSNTSSCNLSISASDFSLSNVPETTEFSFPSSMYMNSLNEKSCSSQIASLVHSTFDKVGEEERKSQSEESSYSFQNEGNCGCKYCHNEIKLSSTILLEITKKLDSMLINQAIIVRSVNPDYSKSMIPSNIPSIPLKSKEDFKKMDMFVTANRVNYEAVRDLLYSKCISAPGTSVPSERSVTGYILSKLISNGLAKQISWSGSEGDKTRFSDTKLCEVVFNAVKLRFPDSFLLHSEAKIKRWFQTANGRKESNNSNS